MYLFAAGNEIPMSIDLANIRRSDFNFELPEESIAKYPLTHRHDSKLLVYRNRQISIAKFRDIAGEIPNNALLVFNNAKVIPARLFFKRITGAVIEILLLEPLHPSNYEQVFKETSAVQWKCMIGNLKKWKEDETIQCVLPNGALLLAELTDRELKTVRFNWNTGHKFLEVLDEAGRLPIPPYLNRDTDQSDYENYQTVFAKREGSVAAPTAGLHFTDDVFKSLSEKGVKRTELTLHVGAGTFLPVKEDEVVKHQMHREFFELPKSCIQNLLHAPYRIAVGTTSLRVLESLYYIAAQIKEKGQFGVVKKLEPYENQFDFSYAEALQTVLQYLEKQQLDTLFGSTEIMILPHYQLKSIDALITNFHLPESTLLMLVASVVGDDWKKMYQTALENKFRFLSYGDSSLLFVQ